jgi:hypothetical protein
MKHLTRNEREMAEAAVEAVEAARIRSELGNDFRVPESEFITRELLMKLGIIRAAVHSHQFLYESTKPKGGRKTIVFLCATAKARSTQTN